jgi:hypothetical protein
MRENPQVFVSVRLEPVGRSELAPENLKKTELRANGSLLAKSGGLATLVCWDRDICSGADGISLGGRLHGRVRYPETFLIFSFDLV